MVVDDTAAIIMNQDVTTLGLTTNREIGVVTNHLDAVQTAKALFEANWTRGAEPNDQALSCQRSLATSSLIKRRTRDSGSYLWTPRGWCRTSAHPKSLLLGRSHRCPCHGSAAHRPPAEREPSPRCRISASQPWQR